MNINILSLILLLISSKLLSQQKNNNPHPGLLVNSSQITEIKKGIKDSSLKNIAWSKLKMKADQYVKEKLEIPVRGGNWEQYYINSITSNVLIRGKQIGNWRWKHYDSKTKQECASDSTQIDRDYDGVVIGLIHNNWALGAMELGLAYQINKDTTYLNKAKQILLGYAALYPTLPKRTRSNGRLAAAGFGRIHVQDLNEAQWLVNIAQAIDFIWTKLTSEEQKLITKKLLYLAVETISERKADITNIQCWRNAAIGSVGFLLGDTALIHTAMGDSIGFNAQILKGFNLDGITKDLSPNYQFFALHPLVLLAQAAINHNFPVNISPMHKMFTTPLLMSNHELMLPPFNDSRPIRLNEVGYLYEWALSKFGADSFYEVLLQPGKKYSLDEGYQFTEWNFLYSEQRAKKLSTHLVTSQKWDTSGIAVLTNGKYYNKLNCYVKYTNQIENLRHLHNAQLDMAIIKEGEYITIMPGNPNYASPLSDGWYRSAVAHNTVLYNETEQRRSSGKCLGFGSSNGVDYVVTATANFYVHSAAFVRTVATINENTVLVIDQFRSIAPESSQFDLAYHQAGTIQDRMPGETWTPPVLNGYKYIIDATVSREKNNFHLRTKLNGGRIVTTFGVASKQLDVVTGYGQPFMNEKVPMTMFRTKTESGEAITIAYCISLDGKMKKITLEKNTNTNKKALLGQLELEDDNGIKTKIIFNPDKAPITVNGITSNNIFEVY